MFKVFSFFLFLFIISSQSFAQRLPLWELGAAVGAAKLPFYRGSAESRNVVLPLPLAIYRGKKYQMDEDGARRWLYKSDRIKLDISLAAGLPVPKDGSVKIRQGMPRLHPVLEVGPVLDVMLWRYRNQTLTAHLPIRFATSLNWLDSSLQGYFISPYIQYVVRSYDRNYWELNVAAGPQYGSDNFHDYYYSVAKEYERNDRIAYDAAAGYSGSRITFYANKRLGKLWMSVFARYDFLEDAVFSDSPLVEKKSYLIGGFVLGWVFMDSPRRVSARPPKWFNLKSTKLVN